MKIRRRLALLGTVLATGTIALFAWLLISLASQTAPADQLTRLRALAVDTAGAFEPGSAERPPVIADAAESIEPFVVVLDRAGTVVYTDAELSGAPVPIPDDLMVSGAGAATDLTTDRFVFAATPWESGVVVAVQSAAFAEAELGGVRVALIIAAVLTAIAGAVASWVVSGRALRPLAELSTTADEVARTGDLTRRLPSGRHDDEVRRLADSFNAMMDRLAGSQQELADSLDAQRRFVADASHELRTPLTSIRSNAGFLAEHPGAATADRTEAIADIAAESERMAALVDGMLALARGDAHAEMQVVPVDLGPIVAAAARRVGAEYRGDGAVVSGDREALTRLVVALAENARLHGRTDVVLSLSQSDGASILTVSDRGPGIPPGDLERVFERFHRADPARTGPGTGLGLAIARQIVTAHGGTIVVNNRPDGGAEFTVRIPV
ncbi:MAG: sensor histidine kinase [Acidimicrobiia bacterium]